MVGQIRQADFVLVVCTENYICPFELDEPRGKGRGAKWEGAIITQQMYDADSLNSKFIPGLYSILERQTSHCYSGALLTTIFLVPEMIVKLSIATLRNSLVWFRGQ